MDLGLKDMRALVVGSNAGLGAALATQLALEGAKVAINGRRVDKLAEVAAEMRDATNGEIIAIPGDVSRPEDVRRIVDEAAGKFGGIDILVTNAGGPPHGAFEQLKPEDWQTGFD